jgi:hypothetical protein
LAGIRASALWRAGRGVKSRLRRLGRTLWRSKKS